MLAGARNTHLGSLNGVDAGRYARSMSDIEDDGEGPVGFLGKLREKKWIVWVTIIGLVTLSVGATSIIWFISLL